MQKKTTFSTMEIVMVAVWAASLCEYHAVVKMPQVVDQAGICDNTIIQGYIFPPKL